MKPPFQFPNTPSPEGNPVPVFEVAQDGVPSPHPSPEGVGATYPALDEHGRTSSCSSVLAIDALSRGRRVG
jgi:hypothetical protein